MIRIHTAAFHSACKYIIGLDKQIFFCVEKCNYFLTHQFKHMFLVLKRTVCGAQWLSGRVLDSRPRGHGFEPHRHHCVVVLEQDTFILA